MHYISGQLKKKIKTKYLYEKLTRLLIKTIGNLMTYFVTMEIPLKVYYRSNYGDRNTLNYYGKLWYYTKNYDTLIYVRIH